MNGNENGAAWKRETAKGVEVPERGARDGAWRGAGGSGDRRPPPGGVHWAAALREAGEAREPPSGHALAIADRLPDPRLPRLGLQLHAAAVTGNLETFKSASRSWRIKSGQCSPKTFSCYADAVTKPQDGALVAWSKEEEKGKEDSGKIVEQQKRASKIISIASRKN